jgi:hypothetical protein
MRRFMAALGAISLALIASAGPAAADVQKLVIKDPGWVTSNVCELGPSVCSSGETSNTAVIELVIKCPEGESFTLIVLVKQGDENQGITQTGGGCTGDGQQRFVEVNADTGSFSPGKAKVKASAVSNVVGAGDSGAFDVNTERKITLVDGPPPVS